MQQLVYVEFYAITKANAKFRHHMISHKFVIKTDQKSLKSFIEQALQNPKHQALLHKLLGYDFIVEYKPGKDNLVVDALFCCFFMAWSQLDM